MSGAYRLREVGGPLRRRLGGWSFPQDDVVGELLASRTSIRVLDLGCGTGRWLVAQHDAFGDVDVAWLAADPSSAMLAEASAKGITTLVRARAEDLPLPDATIDYVVASYAFHQFADKDRAVGEITRVLTADGVLGINNIEPSVDVDLDAGPEGLPATGWRTVRSLAYCTPVGWVLYGLVREQSQARGEHYLLASPDAPVRAVRRSRLVVVGAVGRRHRHS